MMESKNSEHEETDIPDTTKVTSPDDIIREIGGCGRFQVILSISVHLMKTVIAWSLAGSVFILYPPKWRCEDLDIDGTTTTRYNISDSELGNRSEIEYWNKQCVPFPDQPCKSFAFDTRPRTLVSEFGLVCDLAWVPSTIMSMQMAGLCAGNLLAGQIADIFGRKKPMFLSMLMLFTFHLISYFSVSWMMFAICRVFIGLGCGFFLSIQYNLMSEYTLSAWRSVIIGFPSFTIQICIYIFVAWLTQDWKVLILMISLTSLALFGAWFIVPESFRWHIGHDRHADAEVLIRKIAKFNKCTPVKETILMDSFVKGNTSADNKKYTLINLFRNKELLKKTICLMICWRTVNRIRRELREKGELTSPTRQKWGPYKPIDDFDDTVIRDKVKEFYDLRKLLPTIKNLLSSLRNDIGYPGDREHLRGTLRRLGFVWKRTGDNRKVLTEKPYVVEQRFTYYSRKKELEDNGFNLVFIDETWIDTAYAARRCWQAEGIGGVRRPCNRGQRLIIVHAGSSEGFVYGALLIYKSSTSTGDYHNEMNGTNFRKWLQEKLLPNLKGPSAIVMDNASYHSIQTEKCPSSCSRKLEIQEWLRKRGIQFQDKMIKARLLELVRLNKPEPTYEIDTIIRQRGHEVLRLPPYHPDLNPIELIWSQVKTLVRQRNLTFRFTVGFGSYGIGFGVQRLSGNIFLNLFLFNVSSIPSKFIMIFLQNKFGRKVAMLIALTICGLGGLGAGVVQYIDMDAESRGKYTNYLALVADAAIGGFWGPLQTVTVEVFPTVIRSLSFGYLSTMARIGAIIGPQMVYLTDFVPGLLYLAVALVCFLSICSTLCLPETRDAHLQDKITDRQPEKEKDKTAFV